MSLSKRQIVLLGALVLAGAAVLVVALTGGDEADAELFASGTVEATEAHLGFQAPGRVAELRVREGDRVRRGDTLALLDREQALSRRDAAAAEAEAAEAQLAELRSGFRSEEVAQARAALAAAWERREDARRDLERTRILFEGGAASREALDKARTAYEVARNEAERGAQQLRLLEEGPRPETIAAQEARLRAARAGLRAAEAMLSDMVVTAPLDGVVTVRHREPGESVPAGSAVVTVMNPGDRWVEIYVREDRIGAVRLGQEARITTDTYPEKAYAGRVRFIASEAEFTPKNVQTAEERVKLVYAVRVEVSGDPAHELKPGMPADVRLRLEGEGG